MLGGNSKSTLGFGILVLWKGFPHHCLTPAQRSRDRPPKPGCAWAGQWPQAFQQFRLQRGSSWDEAPRGCSPSARHGQLLSGAQIWGLVLPQSWAEEGGMSHHNSKTIVLCFVLSSGVSHQGHLLKQLRALGSKSTARGRFALRAVPHPGSSRAQGRSINRQGDIPSCREGAPGDSEHTQQGSPEKALRANKGCLTQRCCLLGFQAGFVSGFP